MADLILFVWIAASLGIASVIGLLSKRLGSWLAISVVAGMAVISNVLASAKIIEFPFGLTAPAGIIAYSITFFLTDITNEFYGRKEAMKGVYAGIAAQAVAVPMIWMVLAWPAAPFMTPDKITAATTALSLSPWLFAVSLLSFAVGSVINVLIFQAIRKRTGEAFLWLRSKASTITAIFTANLIFIPLGYIGTGFPRFPILNMIYGHSMVQIMIALIDTVFIYLVAFGAKRWVK